MALSENEIVMMEVFGTQRLSIAGLVALDKHICAKFEIPLVEVLASSRQATNPESEKVFALYQPDNRGFDGVQLQGRIVNFYPTQNGKRKEWSVGSQLLGLTRHVALHKGIELDAAIEMVVEETETFLKNRSEAVAAAQKRTDVIG